MNILSVDDNPTNLKLLRALLEAEGLAVFDAADGVEALQVLEREKIDAVISDILMPRMDGYRLCFEVRQHERLKNLPFILFTASYTSPDDEKLALDLGADKLIRKPASAEVLVDVLREVTTEARYRQPRRIHAPTEIEVLKEYSERLVSKLEEKNTELTAQTATLADSRQKLDAIIQSVDGIVWEADAQTFQLTFVSQRAERLLGYPLERWLQEPTFWSDHIHPEDRERAVNFCVKATAEKKDHEFEYRMLAADGRAVWLHDLVSVVVENDRPTKLRGLMMDITERKRTEEASARLIAILEATPDLVSIAGLDGRLVYLNRAGRTMLGIDELADYTTYNLSEFHDVANAHVVLTEGIPTAIREGTWSGETEIVARDGHAIPVSQVILVHKAPNGTVAFLSTIARDVTERRRGQDALRKNDQRLQVALSGINIAVFHQDLALRYTWMHQPQLGYSLDQVVGHTDAELLPPEAARQMTEIKQRVLETGARVREEVGMVVDGATLIFDLVAEPLRDTSGKIIGLTGATLDITERKQVETSLRLRAAALHAAADGIIITDRAGVIEWVNPAFTQLTGYTAEEALGQNPRDLVKSDKQPPTFYKDFWDTILAGRTWQGEMINRRKDGSLYSEVQAVTPILDASGAITHFVAIKKDITERLLLEAQFRQAQKMEMVGQLAGGVAHDFNNLLTAILLYSTFVIDTFEPQDPRRSDMEQVIAAGGRAAALTKQLLAFSRKQVLQPTAVDLNALVTDMRQMLSRLIGEHVDLVSILAPDLCAVRADQGQVEQVLMNLVVNARDAMPSGGRLVIETADVELDQSFMRDVVIHPGSYGMLAVSDSGAGMSKATKQRLFEPFFTTKKPGKGTGLGLATTYGIVKQSGGYIWVFSEPGKGATFKVYLPCADGSEMVKNIIASENETAARTETVLIVEDEDAVRFLMRRILEGAGYRVFDAPNPAQALALFEQDIKLFDLLVTDVVMPGSSGATLFERMARQRLDLKVLFVSGYTDDMIVHQGQLAPGLDLLQKPFSADALNRAVRAVLDR